MFYEVELRSHVRIDPRYFNDDIDNSVTKQLNEQFDMFISKDLGIAIGVNDIGEVG